MKETIVSLLQQRMDKCTTEQFWAVATLTGMSAFLITQARVLSAILHPRYLLLMVTIATAYGTYFVIHRHQAYYFFQSLQADMIREDDNVPDYLKDPHPAWKGGSLSGVVFYVGWIIGVWALTAKCFL
jgi:hypothetical protein